MLLVPFHLLVTDSFAEDVLPGEPKSRRGGAFNF